MEVNKDLMKHILEKVKSGEKAKYIVTDFMRGQYKDKEEVNQHIQMLYSDGRIDGHYDCYELCTQVYGLTPLGEEYLAELS